MSGDPVSWFLIEPGWTVVGRDGERARQRRTRCSATRTPTSSTGSPSRPGFLRTARYVPAERVGAIVEGRVELDLDRDEFDRLDEHGEMPPSAEIRPDTTDFG